MRHGNAYTLDSYAMYFSKFQGYSEYHRQGLGIHEACITDINNIFQELLKVNKNKGKKGIKNYEEETVF